MFGQKREQTRIISEIEKFSTRFSLGRDSNPFNSTGSPHFLRVKIPGGFLTSNQFRRIAEISELYGKGKIEITNRQGIQLHWIEADEALEVFRELDQIGFNTDMCGQGFRGAGHGDVRNVVCCPASGVEEDEVLDGRPLMKKLTKFFNGNTDFLDMPKKFKISISGCGHDCTRAQINDLAFIAVKKNAEAGYTPLLGGSTGRTQPGPRLAQPTGIFIRPEDAFNFAVATAELFRDNGNRESKAKARFKWLLHEWGLEKFLLVLETKLGLSFEEYIGPIFNGRGEHFGINPQSQKGHHYVTIPVLGGRLTSREMIEFSRLADEYGSGELRLTPSQNIIIPHVVDSEPLVRVLEEMGFHFSVPNIHWMGMGCASDFCGKSQSPHAKEIVKRLTAHLEEVFEVTFLDSADFVLHSSGCPNNCCPSNIAEIGLLGKSARKDGQMVQVYDILLGGGFGPEPVFGRRILRSVQHEELGSRIESLLRKYRENRVPEEKLKEFCLRHTEAELEEYLKITEVEIK
ncbi:MAG: nitrite/sulfite reductase [Candidatus Bathyarchaeota archaeon]|nr:nitrite/sulfite reductase [Candidatus Bathyarchaeota archaeon]